MKLPAVTTSVVNGVDGSDAFVYIASADDDTGLNFTYPQDNTQEYIAVINSTTALTPIVSNFIGKWRKINGIDGTNGSDGIFGGVSYEYKFGAAALVGNPGSGYLNLNTTNSTTATILSISDLNSTGTNVANGVLGMVTSTSAISGRIRIIKKTDSSKFADFDVTGHTSITGYSQITLVPLVSSSASPFVQGDLIVVTFSTTGDKGSTGTAGITGARSVFIKVYQWAASAPAAPSGTSTYTWATGATTLPSTPGVPPWTLAIGSPTGAQNLYQASIFYTDSLTSATSALTWSGVQVSQIGAVGSSYAGTSTTNVLIASSGSKTFTTQVGLAYLPGSRVRFTNVGSGNYMEGVTTSYTSSTGVLIFTADNSVGAGNTYNAWNLNIAGDKGSTGVTDVLTTTLSIASADILTLFTTPIIIVPAPGAGKYIQILGGSVETTAVTTAYSSTHQIDFIGGTTGIGYLTVPSTALQAVIDSVYLANFPVNTGFVIAINESIKIKHRTGNPTLGDNTIVCTITYKIITRT